jgi:hypothetical protein
MYRGFIGLTTRRPCVPLGTKSTFSLTSRIIAEVETVPPPGFAALPDGGPIGEQAKTTAATRIEMIRAGERTKATYPSYEK